MLKRTLYASLLSLVTVGFVGCGGEETTPPADTGTPPAVVAPADPATSLDTDTAVDATEAPADVTEAPAPETP